MTSDEVAEKLKSQNDDAIHYLQAGQYENAYAAFASYLKNLVDFEFYDHAAKARVNMANTLYVMGKFHESLECLKTSLDYFEKKRDYNSLNENRIVEGNLYIQLEDPHSLDVLSAKMMETAKCDRHRAMSCIFKIYATQKTGRVNLDMINRALTYAERAKDNAVLRQILEIRADFFEKNRKPLYATIDRDRIANL